MSEHFAGMTGAYAVNALDGNELAAFEEHLADCDDCAREVRELRETAARLGSASAVELPPGLKERVLIEIGTVRQEPPRSVEPDLTTIIRLPREPRRWRTRAAVAVAAVAVILAGVFGGLTVHAQRQLDDAQQAAQRSAQHSEEVMDLVRSPDTRTITGTGEHGTRAVTMVSPRLGKAMFVGTDLAKPPAGQAYQLWFIGGYGYRSPGVLQVGASGISEPVMADVPGGTAGMGVTMEPTGGSAQPTTQPVLQMTIPA